MSLRMARKRKFINRNPTSVPKPAIAEAEIFVLPGLELRKPITRTAKTASPLRARSAVFLIQPRAPQDGTPEQEKSQDGILTKTGSCELAFRKIKW